MQTISCKVDSSVIWTVPSAHRSSVLRCQQLAQRGHIIEGPRWHAGLFLRGSIQIQFCRLWGKKKNRAHMKGREENPGWDPTCLTWHPGSWQTIRPSISSALNQARPGIRPQMSHTSRLMSSKWKVSTCVCGGRVLYVLYRVEKGSLVCRCVWVVWHLADWWWYPSLPFMHLEHLLKICVGCVSVCADQIWICLSSCRTPDTLHTRTCVRDC